MGTYGRVKVKGDSRMRYRTVPYSDRVPRELLWRVMLRLGVPPKLVTILESMHAKVTVNFEVDGVAKQLESIIGVGYNDKGRAEYRDAGGVVQTGNSRTCVPDALFNLLAEQGLVPRPWTGPATEASTRARS